MSAPSSIATWVNRRLLQMMTLVGLTAVATFSVLSLMADGSYQALTGLVFGVSLFCCGLCSLLYEFSQTHPMRPVMRLLDHSAIFLLIAATYTPFLISGTAYSDSIAMLRWVWGLAMTGIGLKLLLRHRYDKVFVILYLALGWFFVASWSSFTAAIPARALVLLVGGGVAYTLGAMIYWRGVGHWTDSIWHGFVLAGFLQHFAAVLSLHLVAPMV